MSAGGVIPEPAARRPERRVIGDMTTSRGTHVQVWVEGHDVTITAGVVLGPGDVDYFMRLLFRAITATEDAGPPEVEPF